MEPSELAQTEPVPAWSAMMVQETVLEKFAQVQDQASWPVQDSLSAQGSSLCCRLARAHA